MDYLFQPEDLCPLHCANAYLHCANAYLHWGGCGLRLE